MSSPKKKIELLFLCLILTGFAILISCSDDEESLSDTSYYALTASDSSPAKIFVFDSNRLNISSSAITGKAPLSIGFNSVYGHKQGIKGYAWEFGDGIAPSSLKRMTRTFQNPGTYNVKLTVRDAKGRTSTDTVKITLTGEDDNEKLNSTTNLPCGTGRGFAHETGPKVWCWGDVAVPSGAGSGRELFSNGQLKISSECSENQITNDGDRVKFRINPLTPEASDWCNNSFNMRAEISTQPKDVRHALGTEEWFGWNYTFGDDYVIDKHNPWLFFQIQQGVAGSPPISLHIESDTSLGGAANAGEFWIINLAAANSQDKYINTGIIPRAGETLNLVVHVIHGGENNGLLEVWESGELLYTNQVRTVYSDTPWGGHAKFGIYKWRWRNESDIQLSLQSGVTHLETYLGAVRMITRKPGDSEYLKNSYAEVVSD